MLQLGSAGLSLDPASKGQCSSLAQPAFSQPSFELMGVAFQPSMARVLFWLLIHDRMYYGLTLLDPPPDLAHMFAKGCCSTAQPGLLPHLTLCLSVGDVPIREFPNFPYQFPSQQQISGVLVSAATQTYMAGPHFWHLFVGGYCSLAQLACTHSNTYQWILQPSSA